MEWQLFEEKNYKICEISVFDDAKEKYRNYLNRWHIIVSWWGKFRLKILKTNINIDSISSWKIKIY